jgi:hypothetical protein
MPIYYVQQKATVWYEVEVEADSPEQALELGTELLENGEGVEAQDSFDWADGFWLGDEERNELELKENE